MSFFAVSDNENLRQLRHVLVIASIQTMIENRRRKFLDYFLNDERFTVVFSVVTFNMTLCFQCSGLKIAKYPIWRQTHYPAGFRSVEQIRAS